MYLILVYYNSLALLIIFLTDYLTDNDSCITFLFRECFRGEMQKKNQMQFTREFMNYMFNKQ